VPSATIHARAAATATRLIDRHGRALILRKKFITDAENPAAKPWNTRANGLTTYERAAAVIGVQTHFKSGDVGGDLTREAMKVFLIDSRLQIDMTMRIEDYGLGVAELPLDQWQADIDAFGIDGYTSTPIQYSIANVTEIKPGNTPILYKVTVNI